MYFAINQIWLAMFQNFLPNAKSQPSLHDLLIIGCFISWIHFYFQLAKKFKGQ